AGPATPSAGPAMPSAAPRKQNPNTLVNCAWRGTDCA
ncbi:hypothetical protein A2U01_0063951, partial [Trifolium medium]|nr:hypothetical protein [Trifolium medium]